jgi:hypothetical protein
VAGMLALVVSCLAAGSVGVARSDPLRAAGADRPATWVSRYHAGSGASQASSVAVSPDGTRVFVTGFSEGPNGSDYATAAYMAATGGALWLSRYDGPLSGVDEADSVVVAPDGSKVFVTGSSEGLEGFRDYTTVAYDAATGTELWVSRYDGPNKTTDIAYALAVSPDGSRVFVTGESGGGDTNWDYATAAYDASTGSSLWSSRYDGAGSVDSALSLVVSPDGTRVFVTGSSWASNNSYDYATLAYDTASGATLWGRRYNGPAEGTDAATAIAVSPDGTTVFVTGLSKGVGTDLDYATVAYGAIGGAKRWVTRYTGPEPGRDEAESVAVSPDGDRVFVTGRSETSLTDWDYATVAYGTDSGTELWATRYDGPAMDRDEAYSVGVSPDGSRVFVTGNSSGTTTSWDYATLAYDAATGAGLWLGRWNSPNDDLDQAFSLAVSPDGASVFVTGYAARGFTSDYATVAYPA